MDDMTYMYGIYTYICIYIWFDPHISAVGAAEVQDCHMPCEHVWTPEPHAVAQDWVRSADVDPTLSV